ncbi:hypothetical protein ACOSQ3_000270 [Xanthoceras sorbifolium]
MKDSSGVGRILLEALIREKGPSRLGTKLSKLGSFAHRREDLSVPGERGVLVIEESNVVVPNKSVSSRNGGAESHNSGGGIFTKNLLDKVVAIVASGNGVLGTKVVKVPVEALAISDEANQE